MRVCVLFFMLGSVVSAAASPAATPGVDPNQFIVYGQPVIALTHVNVIDGTGAAEQQGMTVVISGGRIAAIAKDGDAKIPGGARIVDLSGKTLLPGLVMLHEHLFYPTGRLTYANMPFSFPRLYLAGGVTTLRTAGGINPYADLGIRQWIDAGRAVGPHIFFTGPYITAASPAFPIIQVPDFGTPALATEVLRHWIALGARDFKTYITIPRKTLAAVIRYAHAHGARVTGHLCSVTYREAAELGIDDLEHGLFVSTDFVRDKKPDECPPGKEVQASLAALDMQGPAVKSLIKTLVSHHVALTSTLPVFEAFTPGRPMLPEDVLELMSPRARDNYLRAYGHIASSPDPKAAQMVFQHGLAFEKAFFDAGGQLVSGTDPTGDGGVVPGYSNARELELLVEAGLTVPQAVEVSTLNGARFLGIGKQTGSIVPGKSADLVVLAGDPVKDPKAFHAVETVFKDGVGYDSAKLIASVRGEVGAR